MIGPGHFDVVIVGAGISGIGAAIKLNQMRVTNIAILDKGDSLGGTWRGSTPTRAARATFPRLVPILTTRPRNLVCRCLDLRHCARDAAQTFNPGT